MAIETSIEWADSSCNPAMGCDGCELWSPSAGGTCYAAAIVRRYGGSNPGMPNRFDEIRTWPKRISEAAKWPDLTGKKRPDKWWLSGLPRHIFLGDMGDLFAADLCDTSWWQGELARISTGTALREDPRTAHAEGFEWRRSLDSALAVRQGGSWLEPYLDTIAGSPHRWIFLTKRPKAMKPLFANGVPENCVLMTSVSSSAQLGRLDDLLAIRGARHYGVSFEPVWGAVDFRPWLGSASREGNGLDWVIAGGHSGPGSRDTKFRYFEWLFNQGIPNLFIKQLGSRVELRESQSTPAMELGAKVESLGKGFFVEVRLPSKGGDTRYWPSGIECMREVPR